MVKIQTPDMLSTGNRLVQRVKVELSTRHKWVKQKEYPDDVFLISLRKHKTGAQHFLQECICAQQRLRSAYASMQADQSSMCT